MNTEASSVENPITIRRQAFIDALKAGDMVRIGELLADDAVFMPPNEPTLYGKPEVMAWHEEYRHHFRVAAFSVPDNEVAIDGDWAVETSSYMIAIIPAPDGSRIRDDGRIVAIWTRDPDGSWKIWQQLWNSIKPVGIGTNRYMARLMQKKEGSRR
jgi:ketosteroid isomerase-like protein